MVVETLGHQDHAHHHEEGQCQYLDGGVIRNEPTNRPREYQHERYRHNYRRNHDAHVVDHADR
eukprot:gene20862-40774_t